MPHNQPRRAASPQVSDLTPDQYFAIVQQQVVRLLAARPFEADDVAQNVVVRYWERRQEVMRRYPDPVRFARVSARHGLISWDRTNRSQRCQGSRLRQWSDGSSTPAREWVSGNQTLPFGDGELFDLVADTAGSFDQIVVDGLWLAEVRDQAYEGLSDFDIEAFELVEVGGYQVTEVAHQYGVARETMARRLGRVRNSVAHHRPIEGAA